MIYNSDYLRKYQHTQFKDYAIRILDYMVIYHNKHFVKAFDNLVIDLSKTNLEFYPYVLHNPYLDYQAQENDNGLVFQVVFTDKDYKTIKDIKTLDHDGISCDSDNVWERMNKDISVEQIIKFAISEINIDIVTHLLKLANINQMGFKTFNKFNNNSLGYGLWTTTH